MLLLPPPQPSPPLKGSQVNTQLSQTLFFCSQLRQLSLDELELAVKSVGRVFREITSLSPVTAEPIPDEESEARIKRFPPEPEAGPANRIPRYCGLEAATI